MLKLQEAVKILLAVKDDALESKCDPACYNGKFVIGIAGPRPTVLDAWCKMVREESGSPFDWYFFGGRAAFKTSDAVASQKLLGAIQRLLPALEFAHRIKQEAEDKYTSALWVRWPGDL